MIADSKINSTIVCIYLTQSLVDGSRWWVVPVAGTATWSVRVTPGTLIVRVTGTWSVPVALGTGTWTHRGAAWSWALEIQGAQYLDKTN